LKLLALLLSLSLLQGTAFHWPRVAPAVDGLHVPASDLPAATKREGPVAEKAAPSKPQPKSALPPQPRPAAPAARRRWSSERPPTLLAGRRRRRVRVGPARAPPGGR